MNIFTSLKSFSQNNNKPTIITVGSFDGIHIGHAALFTKLVELGNKDNLETLVLSFSSHPKKVIFPVSMTPKLLNSPEEKIKLISGFGIKNLINIPFTNELEEMSATQFVSSILIKQLKVKQISVGYNHTFGKNREGNEEWLRKNNKFFQLIIHKIEERKNNNQTISSTFIRNLLINAEIEAANQLLGYVYNISGTVVKGLGIGKNLGFPTANLLLDYAEKLMPKNGVYAVIVELDGVKHKGVANIGFKPTISQTDSKIESQKIPQIEVHLFNHSSSFYQKRIVVYFQHYLREEKQFEKLEMLKNQIKEDIQTSKQLLKNYE